MGAYLDVQMYNVGMYNGCIKNFCSLHLKHIKIYQSYILEIIYFHYIQVVFQIYMEHIIPIETMIYDLFIYYYH